jgi:hypothetical protein
LREIVLAENRGPIQKVDATRATLSVFLEFVAASTLPAELTGEAKDVLCLVNSDETPLEELRGAEAKVCGASLRGMYKIFAALGRNIIATANKSMAEGAHDCLLTQTMEQLSDLMVMLQPLDPIQQMDDIKQNMDKALHLLLMIARQGSRAFKDKNEKRLQEFVTMVLAKVTTLEVKADFYMSLWLLEILPKHLPQQVDPAVLVHTFRKATPFDQAAVTPLEFVAGDLIAQLEMAYNEKSMNIDHRKQIADVKDSRLQFLSCLKGWVAFFAAFAVLNDKCEDDFGTQVFPLNGQELLASVADQIGGAIVTLRKSNFRTPTNGF